MPAREPAVADAPLPSTPDREPEGAAPSTSRDWRSSLRSPILHAAVACAVLAGLSAAVLPTVPSYDPWSWINWGRDVFDPHLSFVTGGASSWKPLPVVFTSLYGLLGGAAPTLWVITARAGGLFGLVGVWRLAGRVAGKLGADASLGRAIAGVVAVSGVALTQDWVYYMYRGASEPALIGAALWTIDRFLAGRHTQAFLFGIALGLMRPEAWPFLILYAAWLWVTEPRTGLRVVLVLGLLSLPVLWFVPTWIGSGQPFLAATHAHQYNGHLGSSPVVTAVKRAIDVQVAPVLIAAAVAVAVAWWQGRERLTLWLAGLALGWIGVVVAMVIDGYPGLERFFLPAAGIFCVLAGAGVAAVGQLAAEKLGSARPAPGLQRAALIGVAAVVLAISIPLSSSRISAARAQQSAANLAVSTLHQLSEAVNAVGGHSGVYPCKTSIAAINHSVQTALAWQLHVTLPRVGTVLHRPGLDFVGPHNSVDGGVAPVSRRLTEVQTIAHVGVWRVLRYTEAGHADACAGR